MKVGKKGRPSDVEDRRTPEQIKASQVRNANAVAKKAAAQAKVNAVARKSAHDEEANYKPRKPRKPPGNKAK